jgi:hypothetical protein
MDNSKRRLMLKLGSIAVVSAAMAHAGLAQAQGKDKGKGDAKGGMPHLPESDPQGQALGYKEDGSKVDRKKFANYQPAQTCASCQQFQGAAKDAFGPCAIFPGKAVSAKGWCSAWVKKA